MRANDSYYDGRPLIDRVIIKPYESVRAAWADLLRGEVDMVYEVGVDALDSLEASSAIKTFTFQRGYAFLMLLNTRKPYLADPGIRRALNEAIDREALVTRRVPGARHAGRRPGLAAALGLQRRSPAIRLPAEAAAGARRVSG